ncbi:MULTISPECIES: response regulator transcription factor [Plantibacter]|uniref:response regulator transcription factor n=1 Tax=Plantibacter TaxID=190323 RepID=UPI001785CDE9|nr:MULTISPECIES: response regulator transcription factor [Plantibacter]MBD8103817.1 response regulator transcription factor [Plantibacter sp. CFBP 8775]MBD8467265.1 response regulator transcription factor [Plantibacter sp. CFBP 8798]
MTGAQATQIRVLIVDDEEGIRELLAEVLTGQGWTVETASTGMSAVRTALTFQPDIAVLDIVLPDFSGLDVLDRIRTQLPDIRVLFLTANDAVEDRILGIDAGGDDYVTKPFSIDEVVSRLRGLLRRSSTSVGDSQSSALRLGDLELVPERHCVRRAGEDIRLTAREFALLHYLLENAGRVLSKEQILNQVWDYDYGRGSNLVELYISYLRRKIDEGRPPMIHTIRRVGYVIRAAEPSDGR